MYIHEKTETFCKSDVCFRTWLYFFAHIRTAGGLKSEISGGFLKILSIVLSHFCIIFRLSI